MEKEDKIIFTADLHGNKMQYIALFNYAKKIKAGTIIIGGDLCPSINSYDYIDELVIRKRQFLKNDLPLIVENFKGDAKFRNSLKIRH